MVDSSELPKTYQPVLGSIADQVDLALARIPGTDRHGHVHEDWPPPGLHTVPGPLTQRPPYCFLAGEPLGLENGDWWVTTLGAVVSGLADLEPELPANAAEWFAQIINPVVGTWASWPVIYKHGEGQFMRWIKSIIAGTLGGVEEFQHQVNWGKPGDDPAPNEAALVAIGEDMASQWADALNDTYTTLGSNVGTSLFNSDVKYVELGVVLQTQTDATDVDGGGGNLEQAFETHWAPFNGLTGIVGTTGINSLPYEVACAASLHTDHRGPSGRGRTYFPPFSSNQMGTGGMFSSAAALTVGTMLGRWIDGVKASQDLVPVVVSRRRIILNEVQLIQVGLVPDSQRRRRWSQLESPVVAWEAS